MNYYQLPGDKRWMGDSNPYKIGGRSADVAQIGFTLEHLIKSWYASRVNNVPPEIAGKLDTVIRHLEVSERLIDELIEAVCENVR